MGEAAPSTERRHESFFAAVGTPAFPAITNAAVPAC